MKKSYLLVFGLVTSIFSFAQFPATPDLLKMEDNASFFSTESNNFSLENSLERTKIDLLEGDGFSINQSSVWEEDFEPKRTRNKFSLNLSSGTDGQFFKNRRNTYSSLWAFASLNYLYADLVGLMDKNQLTQYYTGNVNGLEITPNFLTGAAAFMQIPLANVFLPQLIKNERTLRWVQIASASFMTLAQGATLFIGKPTPLLRAFLSI